MGNGEDNDAGKVKIINNNNQMTNKLQLPKFEIPNRLLTTFPLLF